MLQHHTSYESSKEFIKDTINIYSFTPEVLFSKIIICFYQYDPVAVLNTTDQMFARVNDTNYLYINIKHTTLQKRKKMNAISLGKSKENCTLRVTL